LPTTLRRFADALAPWVASLGAALGLAQPSPAQPAPPPEPPAPSTALEAVTVTVGRGQIRSVHGLSRSEFQSVTAPGQSPLLTVSRLPGVNFQSADPLGNYEWSARFTVRGFAQNQLGFTLDGVPLGDMSYGNLNGLHISRAIASENVVRAELSQGAGALETASSSNLGGTLQFYSAAPSRTFGLQAAQTWGSHRNRRSHVRLDSGEHGWGGLYLSLTDQSADKWKGEGQQRQRQLNLKYAKDWGAHRLSAFVNHSQRREVDHQDLSLEMLGRLGPRWDNFYPDFDAALQAAATLCGNGGAPYVARCDDAYYAGAGLRDDLLAGATLDAELAEGLRLATTAYGHRNDGRGLWYTPYTPSPDGTPISLRTTEYGIRRHGVTSTLSWDVGDHQWRLSFWLEHNDFDQARRFYATSPGAVPSPYAFPQNPFLTAWAYAFNTQTQQVSVADTVALGPALSVSAGFKALQAKTVARRWVGTGPEGEITARQGFLPQLGLNRRLGPRDEVFASVSRNMRAYQGAAVGTTPFATTQAGFDSIKDRLRPETCTNVELGWRRTDRGVQAAVTGYWVDFRDRLLGVTQGSAILGNPTVLANVGGVRSLGLEGTLSLRLRPGLSWYSSLSLGRSTYRDDVRGNDSNNPSSTVPIAGKNVVDAPRTLFKSILSVDDGRWFGEAGVDFVSRRYYSYVNDASVPSRTLLNLSVGLRLQGAAGLPGLSESSVRLGITNLSNRRSIATLGSNGFVNSDPDGRAQTLLPGAPRQLFVTFSGKL